MVLIRNFFLGLICTACISAKAGAQATPQDTTAILQTIRSEFEAINKAQLDAISYNWVFDSTCSDQYQAGKVTLYTLNGSIVKIHSEGDAEHGNWKEDFYFKNDFLFFIYQDNAYGGAENPVAYKYQNRYYLRRDQLIKAIETGEPNDQAYVQRLREQAYALRKVTSAAAVSRVMSCDD